MSALIKINPENLEVANEYLQNGSIQGTAATMHLPSEKIAEILCKREVKAYIDQVYLDMGYRNRFKLAETLDLIIQSKLDEAAETEVYSSKDLADLLQQAHKMRMDEIRAMTELIKAENSGGPRVQTNVQINEATPFGVGNYGKLMEKLLQHDEG
jgi:hypothetical protein